VSTDRANYAALCAELRAAMTSLGTTRAGLPYVLTAAVSSLSQDLPGLNVPAVMASMDSFNVMTCEWRDGRCGQSGVARGRLRSVLWRVQNWMCVLQVAMRLGHPQRTSSSSLGLAEGKSSLLQPAARTRQAAAPRC
jgi:hypothetical protein